MQILLNNDLCAREKQFTYMEMLLLKNELSIVCTQTNSFHEIWSTQEQAHVSNKM